MIKLWADSLDVNHPQPMESYLFIKDLITYDNEFVRSISAKDADCIVIPQYSNNYINNLVGNYIFDSIKADYLFGLNIPIIIVNTGGGTPNEWRKLPIYDYIYGEVNKNVTIFSTECYSWHRSHLPASVKYLPYDYVGFVDYGLGLRKVPPLQSKEQYLKRYLGTAVAFNSYPPTRDKLLDMVQNQDQWLYYIYATTPGNQQRVEWDFMANKLLNAKIGFAPDGATGKTERHLFTPSYTVMMMQQNGQLEFPFDWVDGVNCLQMVHDLPYNPSPFENEHTLWELNKQATKEKIIEYLSQPEKLYDIYVNGWNNDTNYQIPNYIKKHVGKTIKENI